jgi:hypothetical protein
MAKEYVKQVTIKKEETKIAVSLLYNLGGTSETSVDIN